MCPPREDRKGGARIQAGMGNQSERSTSVGMGLHAKFYLAKDPDGYAIASVEYK